MRCGALLMLCVALAACAQPPQDITWGPGEAPAVPIASCDDVSGIGSRLWVDSERVSSFTVSGRSEVAELPRSAVVDVMLPRSLWSEDAGVTVVRLQVSGLRSGLLPVEQANALMSATFSPSTGGAAEVDDLVITTGEVESIHLATAVGERTCGVASVAGQGQQQVEMVVWYDVEYVSSR